MCRFSPVLALLVVCQSLALIAEEQEKSPAIEVGRPIAETKAILRTRGIDWWPGAWDETGGSSDNAEIDFKLNTEIVARIHFSASRKAVTYIAVLVCPQGQGKISQRSFEAKGIRLEDDGSYSVQFLPEPKTDKLTPVKKNEVPSSKDLSPRPARQTGAKEQKKSPLEGDWKVCSASYQLSGLISYRFRGERLTIESWVGGIEKRVDAPNTKSISEWTIKIDESRSPPRLVMTSVEPPGTPSVVQTDAFEVKDGELWLCQDSGQKITSQSFLPGAGGWLTGLRRVEKRPR